MDGTYLLLLKEGKGFAQSAVFPYRVSPPPKKHDKSEEQPAEAEFKITQSVDREDEDERLGDVDPGLRQLARGGHRGVALCAARRRRNKVGLCAARPGVSVLLGHSLTGTGWMRSSDPRHAVSRHGCAIPRSESHNAGEAVCDPAPMCRGGRGSSFVVDSPAHQPIAFGGGNCH